MRRVRKERWREPAFGLTYYPNEADLAQLLKVLCARLCLVELASDDVVRVGFTARRGVRSFRAWTRV